MWRFLCLFFYEMNLLCPFVALRCDDAICNQFDGSFEETPYSSRDRACLLMLSVSLILQVDLSCSVPFQILCDSVCVSTYLSYMCSVIEILLTSEFPSCICVHSFCNTTCMPTCGVLNIFPFIIPLQKLPPPIDQELELTVIRWKMTEANLVRSTQEEPAFLVVLYGLPYLSSHGWCHLSVTLVSAEKMV